MAWPGSQAQPDRGDLIRPRRQHRHARVDHDDRPVVDRGDPADQLVLPPGQRQRGPVEALAFRGRRRPDDDDRRVGVTRAARTAASSSASSSGAGTTPSRIDTGPGSQSAGSSESPRSLGLLPGPQRDGGPDLARPDHRLHRVGRVGRRALGQPVPSTESASAARRRPRRSGTGRPCGAEPGPQRDPAVDRPSRRPSGRPSHQVNMVARAVLGRRAGRPSAARNSSRTPGCPAAGSVSDGRRRLGHRLPGDAAGSTVSSAGPVAGHAGQRRAQGVAGVDTLTCCTAALPPPWLTGCTAFGPDQGQPPDCAGAGSSSGSAPSSLRSRVNAAAAARRSSAGSAGRRARARSSPSVRHHLYRMRSVHWVRRRTDLAASVQQPRHLVVDQPLGDPARLAPRRPAARPRARPVPAWPGPARPAAVASVLRAACQSDSTTPAKPHSSLRTSRSSRRVLGHRGPVHRVVAGHHQPGAGLPDARFERHQVQLAQHGLGHPDVVGPALRSPSRCTT